MLVVTPLLHGAGECAFVIGMLPLADAPADATAAMVHAANLTAVLVRRIGAPICRDCSGIGGLKVKEFMTIESGV